MVQLFSLLQRPLRTDEFQPSFSQENRSSSSRRPGCDKRRQIPVSPALFQTAELLQETENETRKTGSGKWEVGSGKWAVEPLGARMGWQTMRD